MKKTNGRLEPADKKEMANKRYVVCPNCGKEQQFKKVFGSKVVCIKCGESITRADDGNK